MATTGAAHIELQYSSAGDVAVVPHTVYYTVYRFDPVFDTTCPNFTLKLSQNVLLAVQNDMRMTFKTANDINVLNNRKQPLTTFKRFVSLKKSKKTLKCCAFDFTKVFHAMLCFAPRGRRTFLVRHIY